MADDVNVDNGSLAAYDVVADEITSPYSGVTAKAQGVKILGGAANSTEVIEGTAANGLEVDVTRVSGSVAVTNAGLTELASAIDTEVQVDVVGALPAGDNNIGNVDVVTLPNVTLAAGTNTNEVVGDAAHDAGVAGNPVLIGFEAKDQDGSALPNAVNAEGDVVRGAASLSGVQYVMVVNEDGSAVGTLNVNSHAVTNAGTFAVQVDGNALTALQLIDDMIRTDDAAFAVGTDEVSMSGFLVDETSTDSADEGDAAAARVTPDRKQIVVNQPHSAGGLSIFRSIDLDEGTLEVVKASPGCVYGMWVTNTATSTRFIKFYDATSGTAGTGTPVITIGIPGNSSDDVSGSFGPGGVGIMFTTGICVGAVTGVADNDTGAPGANEVIVNIFYK